MLRRHVDTRADEADETVRTVEAWRALVENPAVLAVLSAQPILHRKRPAQHKRLHIGLHATREVFGVVRRMAERGMTVILVEHKVEWIAQFADRVIALKDGQIFLDGTPAEVLTSPLLQENGFGVSRYTSAARKAKAIGLWKKEELPVTLEEAVEGFSRANAGRVV